MVTTDVTDRHAGDAVEVIREIAEAVCDPELPFLTLGDLGIIRGVEEETGTKLTLYVSPTYTGCPATQVIHQDLKKALKQNGWENVTIKSQLSPAWSTDWISPTGRKKLSAHGIAPPEYGESRSTLFGKETVFCTHCQSLETEKISEFGATPCKALWRCMICREPFEKFKCI